MLPIQRVWFQSLVRELRSHMLHRVAKQNKTKKNSKCIEDLYVRPNSIKLLEENTGPKLHNIEFGKDLLDVTPQAQVTKLKIDMDFPKILKFCTSKDNRMKRHSMNGRKYL